MQVACPPGRFLVGLDTGAGIGGEYSAINSAIDEMIPGRVRGRVDLLINGSYWLGAGAALWRRSSFWIATCWRSTSAGDRFGAIGFGIGAALGLSIIAVRREG